VSESEHAQSTDDKPRRPIRRWCIRVVGGLFVLLGLCVIGVYIYLSDADRAGRLASSLLTDFAGVDVRVAELDFTLGGRIEMRDVSVRLREADLESEAADPRLFDAKRIELQGELAMLFSGNPTADMVVIEQPVVYLTEDLSRKRYNWQMFPDRDDMHEPAEPPSHLPEIVLRGGRIEFGVAREHGDIELLDELPVVGRLAIDSRDASLYHFFLREDTDADASPGLALTGEFNLTNRQLSAQLSGVAIEGHYRSILPQRIREWWDRLSPSGKLRTVHFGYTPRGGVYAILPVRDIAMTLPYGEYLARMKRVSGQFEIHGETIHINDLKGSIDDPNYAAQYTIDGKIFGLQADAPFTLTASIEGELPDEQQDLLGLPLFAQEQFYRFEPSGRFSAEVTVERREEDGEFFYGGRLNLSDVKLAYHKFYYPLHDVSASVWFDNDSLRIESLRGTGPTGAQVSLSGVVEPPGDGARIEMQLTALEVPVDEYGYAALSPHEHKRQAVRLFQPTEVHDELLKRGVIRLPDTPAASGEANGADVPVFELGGKVDIHATVTRSFGEDTHYTSASTIDVAGLNAIFKYWPYPLHVESGKLHVSEGKVVVEAVKFRGPSGATGQIDGQCLLPREPGEPVKPQLKLTNIRIPMDSLLLASIRPPHDRWLRDLNLDGVVTGEGEIFLREDGEIDYRIALEIDDAAARPFAGRFAMTDVAARIVLRRDHAKVERFFGRRRDATLLASGTAAWPGQSMTLDLDFKAGSLDIDPAIIDLLPPDHPAVPRITSIFETYQPVGVVDARLDFELGEDGETEYELFLEPRSLAFDFRDQRWVFPTMTGQVHLVADRLWLEQLTAIEGGEQLAATGMVRFDQLHETTLQITGKGETFGPLLRRFLPAPVVGVMDRMELRGGYAIPGAVLTVFPEADDQPAVTMDGAVKLIDVSADLGFPVTELNGRFDIRLRHNRDTPWPRLHMDFHLASLRVYDRLIQPLRLTLASIEGHSDWLSIDRLEGRVYDGTLLGEGRLQLSEPGRLHLELAAQDVKFQPMLYPRGKPGEGDEPRTPEPPVGTVDASLSLSGERARPDTREGRGEIAVRNASFYRFPVGMAVLQMINIATPDEAFEIADVSYVVQGETLILEKVRLDASAERKKFELVGRGELQYASREIDLTLVSRNPEVWNLGVISEMLSKVKDELISVRITGTLDDPEARAVSLSGLRETWRNLFGDADETDAEGDGEDQSDSPITTSQ